MVSRSTSAFKAFPPVRVAPHLAMCAAAPSSTAHTAENLFGSSTGALAVYAYWPGWTAGDSSFLISLQRKSSISMSER